MNNQFKIFHLIITVIYCLIIQIGIAQSRLPNAHIQPIDSVFIKGDTLFTNGYVIMKTEKYLKEYDEYIWNIIIKKDGKIINTLEFNS
ncbi:MAG: hypothetical protein HQ562_10320 [Candidatus Marinimicrobia bacterium]|nr:hypothetical protein [Candidatus Neomarinimicrobiota bacterium]